MPYCVSCGTFNEDSALNCTSCQAPQRQAAQAVSSLPTVPPAQVAPSAPVPPPVPSVTYAPAAPSAPLSPPVPSAAAAPPYGYVPTPPGYTPPVPLAPAAPVSAPQAPAPSAPQAPLAAAANGDLPPPPGSRYAVLSSGSVWGSIFLMNIPIIGWIVCLVWAFSRKGNLNRRNLARATLVFIIIQLICWWCAYYLISMAVNALLAAMQAVADNVSGTVLNELSGIGDVLQQIVSFFESLPF